MEERYAVIHKGKKIGTVLLDPSRRGTVRARLAPLPAFRAIARYRAALAEARQRDFDEEKPTPTQLAAEDGAEAVLATLQLALLTDPGGAPVATRKITLLRRDPPHVEVIW